MKLGNATLHDQSQYLEDFRAAGFEVDPTPLLRVVAGPEEAKAAARDAGDAAIKAGCEGIILGGRTDMCVYTAIEAVLRGLKVFVVETKRIRNPQTDTFVFNFAGMTPVHISVAERGVAISS